LIKTERAKKMKRLILIASAALVFAAEAKLEKIADVTLADQQGLVNFATKVGGFINEPMLGMAPAGLFVANPLATQGFGPARGDGKFYAAIYMDGSGISGDIEYIEQLIVNDKVKFAVLYPVSSSKADFLSANPQSKEADGVITWNEMSVIFSADGKYAAVASDADAAREAVAEAAKFYKLDAAHIVVISDDISLDVGKLRVRRKGSAGGHNGLKDIIAHLGSDEFMRIKIGVGAKPHPDYDLKDWVLGKFSAEQSEDIENALKNTVKAVNELINRGIDSAMNKYSK
jgi:aminoacyl-tRNA hydrolase